MGDLKPKISVLGHEDADEYHKLMEAMKTLGFKDVELRETFKLLAALLQIGNFEFEEAMIDNLDACHLIYNSGVKLGCLKFIKILTQIISPIALGRHFDQFDTLMKASLCSVGSYR